MTKAAIDFIEEWIQPVTKEDRQQADICQRQLFSVCNHLEVPDDVTQEIRSSLLEDKGFQNPTNIFYLARWKKEVPCDTDYPSGPADYIKPIHHPYSYPTYEQEMGIWKSEPRMYKLPPYHLQSYHDSLKELD